MTARAEASAAVDLVREFDDPDILFGSIGENDIVRLLQSGADILLALSDEGRIRDLTYRDPAFDGCGTDGWIGESWGDVVTSETKPKVASMLDDAAAERIGPARQVNHPVAGGEDVPVRYRLVKLPDSERLFAVGENMSDLARAQSRLVQAQMELEADYRKLRDKEARYRTVFQMAGRAVLVVDGASQTIMDANRSAGTLLGKDPRKLIGESVPNLLDRTSRKEGVQIMTEAHYQGSAKNFQSRIAVDGQECVISVEPFRENGQNNLLIKFDQDSTVIAANDSHETDGLHILRNLPEGVVLLDVQGNVLAVNEQFLDLVQVLNKDRLIGRHLNNWVGASSVDTQVLLSKLKKESRANGFATVVRGEAGGFNDVVVSAASVGGGGQAQFILIISADSRRNTPITAKPYGADAKPDGISELVGRVPMKELIRDSVDVIEKMCIEAALNQTGNNRASAADLLGLSRQSLYIKLKRYGLEDFGDT